MRLIADVLELIGLVSLALAVVEGFMRSIGGGR